MNGGIKYGLDIDVKVIMETWVGRGIDRGMEILQWMYELNYG